MSFINTEVGSIDCRVVLTAHDFVVDASQLSSTFNAVLLEGLGETPAILQGLITGRGLSLTGNRRHYLEIAKTVKSKLGTFVGLAEPSINLTYKKEQEDKVEPPLNDQEEEIGSLLYAVATTPKEIKRNSRIFDDLSLVASYLLKACDPEEQTLRNLLMAQRVSTLGRIFQKAGVYRPKIDLVTGAAHIDTINALELDEETRVAKILEDPLLPKMFDTEHLHIGILASYNPARRRWTPVGFDDPALTK